VFNDLWSFDLATQAWKWESGSATTDGYNKAKYGKKGTADGSRSAVALLTFFPC
jgi:hypothetical protein